MADFGIERAFARFGAKLHNVQWSVSAWNTNNELVVSLWAHHYDRNSPAGVAEYFDRLDRWRGPGNAEFRNNLTRAYEARSVVRLVVASTHEVDYVQSGKDASTVKKSFDPRTDLIGELILLDGENYRFRFGRA
ncbi:hypothetical protein AB4Z32_20855 [Massilia sp. 2TAF26]|uniref:hypothetical protein n=1 Tax=Massilia sp. 2TAF26 TaxID=3233012 RepID=UPI003F976406